VATDILRAVLDLPFGERHDVDSVVAV
jgi:hypothetical protein